MMIELLWELDIPQLAHAAAALAALYAGRRAPLEQRLLLWGACAAMFLAMGWAGYRWGRPGWPLSLKALAEDPHLFKLGGLVELRTIDHVIHLFLGGYFAAAAALAALEAQWSRGYLSSTFRAKPAGAVASGGSPAGSGGEAGRARVPAH